MGAGALALMGRSLKANYILNLINTISGLLVPVITFPYVSRIMLADGIGIVNFFSSIISYISLLTCLGIPTYAVKEIARVRDNVVERDRTAAEILLLHTSLTVLGYVAVAVIAATVGKVQVDIPLFLILSLTLFFSAIGCEWFYQGVEDFKYITIRGLVVKGASLVLLFLLVKSREDLYWYACYLVVGTLGSNLFNFFRLRKWVSVKTIDFKALRPLRHLAPALRMFAVSFVTSLYVQLNTVLLGFMSGETAVGLFAPAVKLTRMLLSVGGTLTTSMLPFMSNVVAKGAGDKFRRMYRKSMRFMIGITLPMTIGLIVCAPAIIPVFAGPTYQPSIRALQLLAPMMLAINMASVLGFQVLYPQGKEDVMLLCCGLGAVVSILLNVLLIPTYAQAGAAIATTMTEVVVTASMFIAGRKWFSFDFGNRSYFCYFLGSALMLCAVLPLGDVTDSNLANLLVQTFVGVAVYAATLLVMREDLVMEMLRSIVRKLKSYGGGQA